MVDVIVEINGMQQLNLLDPELLSPMKRDIEALLVSHGWEERLESEMGLVYRFSPGKRETEPLFRTLQRVWEALEERKEHLRGYNLLVDRNSYEGDEVLEKLECLLLQVPEDETFWISKDALELFSSFGRFESTGNGGCFLGPVEKEEIPADTVSSFMDSHPSMERFLSRVFSLIHREEDGLVFLHGPEGSGKIHAVHYLERLIGKGKEVSRFLQIQAAGGFTGPAVPLLQGVRRLEWEGVAQTLTGVEKRCWDDRVHLLHLEPEQVSREDGELLFALFIKAYKRYMEKHLYPALVIIRDLAELRPETIRIAARQIHGEGGDSDITLILEGRGNTLPAEFGSSSVHQLHLRPWTPGSIASCFPMELPEGVDPEKEIFSVSLYHMLQLLRAGSGLHPSTGASKTYLKSFSSAHRRALLQICISPGFFTIDSLHRSFGNSVIERGEFSTLVTDLIDYGFVKDDQLLVPIFPNLEEFLEKEFAGEREGWRDAYAQTLLEQLYQYNGELFIPGEAFFDRTPYKEESLQWVLGRIERLLAFEQGYLAAPWFEEATRRIMRLENPPLWMRDTLDSLYLLSAVREGRDGLAQEIAGKFMERPELSDFYPRNLRRLALGEYLLAVHSYRKALDPAKTALLELQDQDLNRDGQMGEAGANLLLGRILLAMHRIDEAKDYFLIARESPAGSREADRSHEIAALLGITYFLEGNYTAALRESRALGGMAAAVGRRRWEMLGLFLQGRVLFTLGRYQEAESCFSTGMTGTAIHPWEGAHDLFHGWTCRSMTYQGKTEASIQRLIGSDENPEHRFFLAEAHFLAEQYPEALKAIEEARRLERDRVKLFTRPLPWSIDSGFDCLEDLAFADPGRHGMLFQRIRAWHGLILSRNGRVEEGQQELGRLTREDKLSDQDPESHLYLFFQTLMLPDREGASGVYQGEDEGPDGLDKLTQLSKALRFVQGIGSRIEKAEDRKDFLYKNYWNAKLTARGRAAKLI